MKSFFHFTISFLLFQLFIVSNCRAQSITAKCALENEQQLPYYENSVCYVPDDGGIVVLEYFVEKKVASFILSKYSKSLQKEWSKTVCVAEPIRQYYHLISNNNRIRLFLSSYDAKLKTGAINLYQYDLKGNPVGGMEKLIASGSYSSASYIVSPDRTKLVAIPAFVDEVWVRDPGGAYIVKNATGAPSPKMKYVLYDLIKGEGKESSITLNGLTSAVVSDAVLSNSGMMSFFGFNAKKPYLMRADIIGLQVKNKIASAISWHKPLALQGENVFTFESVNKPVTDKKGNVLLGPGGALDGFKCYTYDFTADNESVTTHKLDAAIKTKLSETYSGHRIEDKDSLDGFWARPPVATAGGYYLCIERQLDVVSNDNGMPGTRNLAPEVVEVLSLEMVIAFVDLDGNLKWTKVLDKESTVYDRFAPPVTNLTEKDNALYLIYENRKSSYTKSGARIIFTKPDMMCAKADADGNITNKVIYPDYKSVMSKYYDEKTCVIEPGIAVFALYGLESKKRELHRLEF